MDMARFLAVARGDEPADLVLRNCRLVDVVSGGIRPAEIAVVGGHVAGIDGGYRGREEVDLGGRYVCPGFIDPHVHLESAQVRPREFSRCVVPRGVTTVVSNPHEIANVVGLQGIRFMLADAGGAPLDQLFTIPSSVPATSLSTSGGRVTMDDIRLLLGEPGLVGLGEVMDFPGVVAGDARVLEEIALCRGLPIDGHCPGLSGMGLNAYAAAGITSEHECTTVEEAGEKLARGMKVFIRQGSVARNLEALLPLITPLTERWLSFCTDDRRLADLLDEGSIDHILRMAIAAGVEPVTAIRMATLNPAEHYRLHDRGVIAPGRRADLVVFADLGEPRPELVYRLGTLVARHGRMTDFVSGVGPEVPPPVRETVHIDWSAVDFRIPARGGRVRVIGCVPGQLLTESLVMEPTVLSGEAVADPGRDLLRIAVVERHLASGRVGQGFVRGIGLRRGAIAGTVAHDHHNLVVIGADNQSMMTAARCVAEAGGGQAVACGEELLALLPLPIAGLMSDRPAEEVYRQALDLSSAAEELGGGPADPFMTMSFLGLEVIPALKLTDLGLIDVPRQRQVPLFADYGGGA